jgi:OmpA-OmpF porin, OOP family
VRIIAIFPFVAATLLVAGCSSFRVGPDRDAAMAAGPGQDPFRSALVSGYKSLGANQYAEADYVASDVYYRKAQAAATGGPVPLEDPANWTSLTPADRQDVAATRPGLQSWIDANSQRDPQGAAGQQLKYDCWIEELNEQEYADAAACKPGTAVAQVVQANCTANPNGLDANGKLCQEGVIYFAWDRYDLLNPRENADRKQTVDAQAAVLDLIVRQVNTIKPARIDVIGRADASGPEDYNYGLSECRARSVVDALKARGVPAGIDIRTIPLGKTDLIVPTADGVRDPANRVVMVAYQTDRNAPLARNPAPKPKKDLFNCGGSHHPYPPRG